MSHRDVCRRSLPLFADVMAGIVDYLVRFSDSNGKMRPAHKDLAQAWEW